MSEDSDGRAAATEEHDVLLTVPEVAERLNCSKHLVYKMIKRGQLAAHDLGYGKRGAIRVPEGEVRRLLDDSSISPPAATARAS